MVITDLRKQQEMMTCHPKILNISTGHELTSNLDKIKETDFEVWGIQ